MEVGGGRWQRRSNLKSNNFPATAGPGRRPAGGGGGGQGLRRWRTYQEGSRVISAEANRDFFYLLLVSFCT